MSNSKLKDLLNAKARERSRDEVLKAMGYSPVRQSNRDRLDKILAEETLGLEGNDYDLKHDSRGFLKALCAALDIDYAEHESEVEAIHDWIVSEREAFQPYLFADTGFKRSDRPGTPIFALACLESRRNLRLSRQSRLAPREEVIAEAVDKVRSHYRETGGELYVWGTINRYLLFLAPKVSLVIDTGGGLQGQGPQHVPSRSAIAV